MNGLLEGLAEVEASEQQRRDEAFSRLVECAVTGSVLPTDEAAALLKASGRTRQELAAEIAKADQRKAAQDAYRRGLKAEEARRRLESELAAEKEEMERQVAIVKQNFLKVMGEYNAEIPRLSGDIRLGQDATAWLNDHQPESIKARLKPLFEEQRRLMAERATESEYQQSRNVTGTGSREQYESTQNRLQKIDTELRRLSATVAEIEAEGRLL